MEQIKIQEAARAREVQRNQQNQENAETGGNSANPPPPTSQPATAPNAFAQRPGQPLPTAPPAGYPSTQTSSIRSATAAPYGPPANSQPPASHPYGQQQPQARVEMNPNVSPSSQPGNGPVVENSGSSQHSDQPMV